MAFATMHYTHLPLADRERYTSEASTTTTSIVQRFERGLNEVGVTSHNIHRTVNIGEL